MTNSDDAAKGILAWLDELLQPGGFIRRAIEAWPKVAAYIDGLSVAVRESYKEAGLPPSRFLSHDHLNAIKTAFDTEGLARSAAVAEQVARAIIGDETIRAQMVADWAARPLTVNRIAILRDALTAHELGLYCASIPPFIAQVEGIIADGMHPPDEKLPQKVLKKYIAELGEGDEFIDAVVCEFVTSVVLEDFQRGDAMPLFSRHAILHGADFKYGTEINSLRAILTFDYVQELLSERTRAQVAP